MRALLDINVLLALFDQAHVQHNVARAWITKQAPQGWASCPLTQNGFVRIIAQPNYPRPVPVAQALALLSSATTTAVHQFWPDDVSILDPSVALPNRIHGPRQLTDIYLLALAVAHDGFLATFDASIPLSAVPAARSEHLVVI
jgi:hypothetical protein